MNLENWSVEFQGRTGPDGEAIVMAKGQWDAAAVDRLIQKLEIIKEALNDTDDLEKFGGVIETETEISQI